jgi:hypothetical protein
MSISEFEVRAVDVQPENDRVTLELEDGRAVSFPVAWFPRLAAASERQRSRWEFSCGGYGVHWPDIDEDVSVASVLRGLAEHPGAPASRFEPTR